MRIKSRRRAREIALRTLYELEVGKMGPAKVVRENLAEAQLEPALEEFAKALIEGVIRGQEWIDEKVTAHLNEWGLDRLAVVDRCVLRIATLELYEMPAVPPAVTLNEAIEISKKYSTAESGKFVNGVLASVLKDSPKAEWTPPEEAEEEEGQAEPIEDEIPEVEEVEVTPDEAEKLAKIGNWSLRKEGP